MTLSMLNLEILGVFSLFNLLNKQIAGSEEEIIYFVPDVCPIIECSGGLSPGCSRVRSLTNFWPHWGEARATGGTSGDGLSNASTAG